MPWYLLVIAYYGGSMRDNKIISLFSLAFALAAGPVLAGGDHCHWDKSEAKAGSAVDKAAIHATADKKAQYQARFPEIKQDELVKAVQAKTVFLIDANGSESYAEAHIPGAVNFDKLEGKFAESLPQDKQALIVAYCGGPGCQAWCQAADKLEEMGYTNVRHFKGGIKGWKTAGLETSSLKGKS